MNLAEAERQLDGLSLPELQELKHHVTKAIDTRAKQERSVLLEKMDAMAKKNGFGGLDALLGNGNEEPAKQKRKPVEPKYRNPANHDDTWSGRGRKPRWMEELLNAGGSMEDALIEK